MRYYGFCLIVLFLFSCSKGARYEKNLEADVSLSVEEVDVKMRDNSYEVILSEKLHNYVDLLRLKNNHPDFEEDILIQLQDLSKEKVINIVGNSNNNIKNIRIEHSSQKASDSIKEFKLRYEFLENLKKVEDSIFAIVKTRAIIIDGQLVKSNKVKFYK